MSKDDPVLPLANDRFLEVSTGHCGQLHADWIADSRVGVLDLVSTLSSHPRLNASHGHTGITAFGLLS